jgi:hypothetical protein
MERTRRVLFARADAHDVSIYLDQHFSFPIGVTKTGDVDPGPGIRFGRTSSRYLAAWLARSINLLLDGNEPAERPPGYVLPRRTGKFRASGARVLAERHGESVVVATCLSEAESVQLAARLNALLAAKRPTPPLLRAIPDLLE